MPQIKIIILAHPVVWNTKIKDFRTLEKSFLSLNESSKSWVDIKGEYGERKGIYKIEKLNETTIMHAQFVSDGPVKDDYPCMEKILEQEGCLPEDVDIPIQVPRPLQSQLYFDLEQGICYMYSQGYAPRRESIVETLFSLQHDLGIPSENLRFFEWEETIVTTVTDVARRKGYVPYEVRANLENVLVTAIGDLENNDDWTKMRDTIDLDKWTTVAYVNSEGDEMFIFGLIRRNRKRISLPYIKEMSAKELYSKILEMREIIEQSLGEDIRRYCFPEQLLDEFFEEDSN